MGLNIGEKAEKIVNFIFAPTEWGGPKRRRVSQVAASVAIIGAGVFIFFALNAITHGGGLGGIQPFSSHFWTGVKVQDYADPSYGTVFGLMLPLGISALGAYMLLLSLTQKNSEKTIAKVLLFALPLFLAGASACFLAQGIYTGYHANGINGAILNYNTAIGVMLFPTIFFALAAWGRGFRKKPVRLAIPQKRMLPSTKGFRKKQPPIQVL